MQKRQTWRYALVALCVGLPGAARADETWHVTSGTNGEEHSTWTVLTGPDGTIAAGRADVTSPEGSKTNLQIFGSAGVVRVMGMMPHSAFCQFDVHEISADKASGVEMCISSTKGTMPWSATIDAQQ